MGNERNGSRKRTRISESTTSQKLSSEESAKKTASQTRAKGTKKSTMNSDSDDLPELVTHAGGCHCGAVRFSVQAASNLDVVQCNCSVCTKKQNHHFIVPKARFRLIQGGDVLTTYTYNTHKAKHTFCKICGVQSFYTPRSNQDGYGIMPHCLDPGTVKSTNIQTFDGNQWEASIQNSDISKYSKEPLKKKKRRS